MPRMSSKTLQAKTEHSQVSSSARPKGAALAPPRYGIDFVDRQRERENKTGLPGQLKAGIEHLSGLAMDDVRVHYHSSKPAELQALAYTQGTDIFVGPGQERHLPHEAWHVVQQKQGRVRATRQMAGVQVNDDKGLEREAEVRGGRAAQRQLVISKADVDHDELGCAATGRDVPQAVAAWESRPDRPAVLIAPSTSSAGGAHSCVSNANADAAEQPTPALTHAEPQTIQMRGARSRRRKRWKAIREGRQSPRKQKEEVKLNLESFGQKQVTVYRVEHEAKPAILHSAPGAGNANNVDITVKDGRHWFSFGTPARAEANFRQRVANQLDAYRKEMEKNPTLNPVLPHNKMPVLKSFKVSNRFAKQIQRGAVLESKEKDFPDRPLNSDQNWAPNQFGLREHHLRAMEEAVVPGSYKEYKTKADHEALAEKHGCGRSADDHMRRDPYPSSQLHKELGPNCGRGRGPETDPLTATYLYASDPFEYEESDEDIDDEARRFLLADPRGLTLKDFWPSKRREERS